MKKLMTGLAVLGAVTLSLAGCSSAKAQTVDEACDHIIVEMESLGNIPENMTGEEYGKILTEIGEGVTNKEVKEAWDNMKKDNVEAYEITLKLSDENISEEESNKLYSEMEESFEKFNSSFEELAGFCPAILEVGAEDVDVEDIDFEDEVIELPEGEGFVVEEEIEE